MAPISRRRRGQPMSGRVINVRYGEPYDAYIGRANPRYGLKASKWANPYRLDRKHGTTTEVALERYEAHIRNSPDLMAALPELAGLTLGCWCAGPDGLTAADPLICHGQVLLRLLDELEASDVEH